MSRGKAAWLATLNSFSWRTIPNNERADYLTLHVALHRQPERRVVVEIPRGQAIELAAWITEQTKEGAS